MNDQKKELQINCSKQTKQTEGFYEHILASWDPVHEDSEWEPAHNKP